MLSCLVWRVRTPAQTRTYWAPRFHCCWSLWPVHCWLYSPALWLNQTYVCFYLQTKTPHMQNISTGFRHYLLLHASSEAYWCGKNIYCRPRIYSDLLKISIIKCCRAFTHHHPLTSPPLFCSCWRQACLCSQGHSVDLQVWHFLLAAPCGETRSRGPCAPSGFSIDLNNCKTQKRFAKHRNVTFWTFECHTLCKSCLAQCPICLWLKILHVLKTSKFQSSKQWCASLYKLQL